MFDYNEETSKKNFDSYWRHSSRSNYYYFSTENGYKDIVYFVEKLKVKSVLDYGCGNNFLSYVLGDLMSDVECVGYDPFVPHFSNRPKESKELTVCYSVLQCIPDEKMDVVIKDLHELTKKYILINVNSGGFFHRDSNYYVDLIEKNYSHLFDVVNKLTQTNELTTTKVTVETGDILHQMKKVIEQTFFLLEVK